MSDRAGEGRVAGLQRSPGGVPKLPVTRVAVTQEGMEGDRQRNRKHHGGPARALCCYSGELLDALAAEGHPVAPGVLGENVTIRGIDWQLIAPGVQLHLGNVVAEVTAFAPPCATIAHAFADAAFHRIAQRLHPGWSRVYARVIAGGEIIVGDAVRVQRPRPGEPQSLR